MEKQLSVREDAKSGFNLMNYNSNSFNYRRSEWPSKYDEKQIQIFFERLREQRPSPQTELKYSSPFELLIAVMLSAQATDVSVNKATDKLYPVANTAEKIYNLGVDGLKSTLKRLVFITQKPKMLSRPVRF